jgi:molecular chaperone GrpE
MSNKKGKESQSESEAEQSPLVPSKQEERPAADGALESFSMLDELQKQLAEAQARADEYKDGWQRAVADFQNYKRRTDNEKADAYQNAVGNVISRYLPILDDLERALASRPDNLQTILENEGLKRIEAEGQQFDPNFHEAISQEPVEGMETGTVIAVIQQGYTLGGRVIRPAAVRVAQ